MTPNEGPRKVLPNPEIHDPLRSPLELVCGACGETGKYSVGRIYLDPTLAPEEDPDWLNKAFCFTAYFHCKHCQAGGPWELAETAKTKLMMLLVEARRRPHQARIHVAHLTLFDGSTPRWATQGEAHLKQLIEKDPGNYFLWSRLGNLYTIGEARELALEAYLEAIKRNEHDVESLHSIAQIYEEKQADDVAAARYYHQVRAEIGQRGGNQADAVRPVERTGHEPDGGLVGDGQASRVRSGGEACLDLVAELGPATVATRGKK
jgi:hypothetical protein